MFKIIKYIILISIYFFFVNLAYYAQDFAIKIYLVVTPSLFITIIILKYLRVKNAIINKSIVAQYSPLEDVNIITSALVIKRIDKVFAAMVIDLAIKKNIVIMREKDKGVFSAKLLSVEDISEIERKMLQKMYGKNLLIGSTVIFTKGDSPMNLKLYNYFLSLRLEILRTDYFDDKEKITNAIKTISYIWVGYLSLFFIFLILSDYRTNDYIFKSFSICVLVLSPYILMTLLNLKFNKPLSKKGMELSNYLKGMKMYIKIAEKDRINILQSPDRAERVLDVKENKFVIRLYEKLLPYAILFGLEKKWANILFVYYQDDESLWTDNLGPVNVVLPEFTASLPKFKISHKSINTISTENNEENTQFNNLTK